MSVLGNVEGERRNLKKVAVEGFKWHYPPPHAPYFVGTLKSLVHKIIIAGHFADKNGIIRSAYHILNRSRSHAKC
jgi:hypothetical protein